MQTHSQTSANRWANVLLSCLLIGVALSAVRAYVGIFYAGQEVDRMLVWSGSDLPNFRTPGSNPVPIWGAHYFGDLQEVLTWTHGVLNGLNPYDYLANYPPFAFFVTLPIAWMSAKVAVPLFIALGSISLVAIAWQMTRGERTNQRISSVILCLFVTAPFLALLDRGNLTLLIAVLVGIYLLMWSRQGIASLLLGTSIAIKLFPLTLLAFAIGKRRTREIWLVLATTVILTTISLIILPVAHTSAVSGFIGGLTKSSTESSSAYNYSTLGLFQQVEQLMFRSNHLLSDPSWTVFAFAFGAVAWLGVSIWLIRAGTLPDWALGLIVLAGLQLVPPSSNVYTCFGAMFAAIWFITPNRFPAIGAAHSTLEYKSLRVAAIVYFVATLTPIGIHVHFGQTNFGLSAFLSPVAAWTFLFIAVIRCRKSSALVRPGGPLGRNEVVRWS